MTPLPPASALCFSSVSSRARPWPGWTTCTWRPKIPYFVSLSFYATDLLRSNFKLQQCVAHPQMRLWDITCPSDLWKIRRWSQSMDPSQFDVYLTIVGCASKVCKQATCSVCIYIIIVHICTMICTCWPVCTPTSDTRPCCSGQSEDELHFMCECTADNSIISWVMFAVLVDSGLDMKTLCCHQSAEMDSSVVFEMNVACCCIEPFRVWFLFAAIYKYQAMPPLLYLLSDTAEWYNILP